MKQLSLFPETNEEKLLREFANLKKETSNLRKGLYKRHGELQKKLDDALYELETIKAAISRATVGTSSCKSKSSNIIPITRKKENSTELYMFS